MHPMLRMPHRTPARRLLPALSMTLALVAGCADDADPPARPTIGNTRVGPVAQGIRLTPGQVPLASGGVPLSSGHVRLSTDDTTVTPDAPAVRGTSVNPFDTDVPVDTDPGGFRLPPSPSFRPPVGPSGAVPVGGR